MADSDIRSLFDLLKPNVQGRLPVKNVEEALPGLQETAPLFAQLLAGKVRDNRGQEMSFEEFREVLGISACPDGVGETVGRVFPLVDRAGKEAVSLSDLQQLSQTLRLDFSPNILERMIEAADRDGDGLVTKEDLISFLAPYTPPPLTSFGNFQASGTLASTGWVRNKLSGTYWVCFWTLPV